LRIRDLQELDIRTYHCVRVVLLVSHNTHFMTSNRWGMDFGVYSAPETVALDSRMVGQSSGHKKQLLTSYASPSKNITKTTK